MHIKSHGKEKKPFVGRIGPAAVEYDHGYDGMSTGYGKPECPVMKGFYGFRRSVSGSFRVYAHMQSYIQYFLHFIKTFPPAFIIFPVHEYAACFVYETEEGNFRHFGFRNGFISSRNSW